MATIRMHQQSINIYHDGVLAKVYALNVVPTYNYYSEKVIIDLDNTEKSISSCSTDEKVITDISNTAKSVGTSSGTEKVITDISNTEKEIP